MSSRLDGYYVECLSSEKLPDVHEVGLDHENSPLLASTVFIRAPEANDSLGQTSSTTCTDDVACHRSEHAQMLQGSDALARQLKVAGLVYDEWTVNGSQEAKLAERYFDGSMESLECLLKPQQSEPDHPEERIHTHTHIAIRHKGELTYEDFVSDFMIPNRPVIIQGINEGWKAARDWVNDKDRVNVDFLRTHFGCASVCCTELNRAELDARYRQTAGYGSGTRQDMSLSDFLDLWNGDDKGGSSSKLYLKDWHFVNDFPDYQAYQCPRYFQDDWLNDYFDLLCKEPSDSKPSAIDGVIDSDYRFVYLGKKGTWTPIHADVLRSYSWSTNIAGRKKWLLLPPEHTPLLFDKFGREMAPSFDLVDESPELAEKFPNLQLARKLAVEVDQGVNEAIFVPSCWHHSVHNTEDTLSINHNWINGYNIHWAWHHIQEEREGAEKAIHDCRQLTTAEEFEELVQRNMAMNCGLNFYSMAHFMGRMAVQKWRALQSKNCDDPQYLATIFSMQRAYLILEKLLMALAKDEQRPGMCDHPLIATNTSPEDSERVMIDCLTGLIRNRLRADRISCWRKLVSVLRSSLSEYFSEVAAVNSKSKE